jgi:hypothetical protein
VTSTALGERIGSPAVQIGPLCCGRHIPASPIPGVGLTGAMIAADLRLALAVCDAYLAATGMPYPSYLGSQGVYRSNAYGGTNLSRVPKIFIETGCLSQQRSGNESAISSGRPDVGHTNAPQIGVPWPKTRPRRCYRAQRGSEGRSLVACFQATWCPQRVMDRLPCP